MMLFEFKNCSQKSHRDVTMWPSSPAASAADYGFDQTVDVSFHNCDYTLRVSATESHLLVEAEQKDDGARWCSEFSSRCAEALTATAAVC